MTVQQSTPVDTCAHVQEPLAELSRVVDPVHLLPFLTFSPLLVCISDQEPLLNRWKVTLRASPDSSWEDLEGSSPKFLNTTGGTCEDNSVDQWFSPKALTAFRLSFNTA